MLNLYANADLSSEAFRELSLSRKFLWGESVAYNGLRFLDVCGCKKLSDENVIEMCKRYPELSYLNLVRPYHSF